MKNISKYSPNLDIKHLSLDEAEYLENIFERFGGYPPSINEIWALMDAVWDDLQCDAYNLDHRVDLFYKHPVWLLLGLFIEQDYESITNRKIFKKAIIDRSPTRVAEIGGGFGTLARLIGQGIPTCQVEIVEPFPSNLAVELASHFSNVTYVSKLTGKYDILIATDVFEHVSDPISLTLETASHLKVDGEYLIANCFYPFIKCHLPYLYHFSISWDLIMKALGFVLGHNILYGRFYRLKKLSNISYARTISQRSKSIYKWISWMPKGRTILGRFILNLSLLIKI